MRPITYEWKNPTTILGNNILFSNINKNGELPLTYRIPDDICQQIKITLNSAGSCTVTLEGELGLNTKGTDVLNLAANGNATSTNYYNKIKKLKISNYVVGNATTDSIKIETVKSVDTTYGFGFTKPFKVDLRKKISQFSISITNAVVVNDNIIIDVVCTNDILKPDNIKIVEQLNWFRFKTLVNTDIDVLKNNCMIVTAPTPCTAVIFKPLTINSGFKATIQQMG